MKAINLIHGDCIEKMKELETNSVDSIVTSRYIFLYNTDLDFMKTWVSLTINKLYDIL